MMHHKVIRRAPIKSGFNVTQPFVNETSINRVSYRHLFADNNVAVVRHAVFANIVLPFKQIDIMIVYAYILDSFGYLHRYPIPDDCDRSAYRKRLSCDARPANEVILKRRMR